MLSLLPWWTSAFLLSLHHYCTNKNLLPRDIAKEILDDHVLPKQEYGKRIEYGRDAQGLLENEDDGVLIKGDDPLLSFTYGEFPLHSTDILLDAALKHLEMSEGDGVEFVDVGSGCGRLCLYLAMTRSGAFQSVHGIEIGDVLHQEALRAQSAAVKGGWLTKLPPPQDSNNNCHLSLHHGPADTFPRILENANLIFCYSTAWETSGFSTEISAMILSNEWTELFSTMCKPGCIVVTTDRALDPRRGWTLIDRIDVSNPEVFESTGFIQQLTAGQQ